jgi:hypothetical protein
MSEHSSHIVNPREAHDMMLRAEALFRLLISWFGAEDWTGPQIDVDLARSIDRWFHDYGEYFATAKPGGAS